MLLYRGRALRILVLPLSVLAILGLIVGLARAQNPVSDLMTLINAARIREGLHPYVIGAALRSAAQRHSEDMASTGQVDHTGSDGSSSTQRVLEAGYGVYEFGLVASENIYAGTGGAQVAFDEWLSNPGARSNLLSSKYREVGIGFANDAQGRAYWTLTVGAQPNVLPVLINDGAGRVGSITVTLRLVPENVVPEGLGTAMGQPQAYRASTDAEFTDAEWTPWATIVDFGLDETTEPQTVYVQLRDANGRTAIARASATVGDPDATDNVTGTIAPGVTVTPTLTSLPSPEPSETPTVSPEPTNTITATATLTPTAVATATPTPSATPTPTSLPSTATASPQPSQTPAVPPAPTDSPVPTEGLTHTPLPTATAANTPLPIEIQPTPVFATTGAVGSEDEVESWSLASRLAPWALGLQLVALVLGVYVALRRPGE